MSRKQWLGLSVCSLALFPIAVWLEDASSLGSALLLLGSLAVGIIAFMKSRAPRRWPAPAAARGPSYRDIALLRSLGVAFLVAAGLGVPLMIDALEDSSGWLLLAAPGGGAAIFFLTLWLQIRGRDELGDPSVPAAGVIRRRR
jgi:hypothetical protein